GALQLEAAAALGCDVAAREVAAERLAARDWAGLRGHPCVPGDVLDQLEAGVEDPADAVEYLGERVVADAGPAAMDRRRAQAEEGLSFLSVGAQHTSCVKGLLPKVMYIGVGHSGSTTLADAMNLHPDLTYGQTKEHNCIWNYNGDNKAGFIERYTGQFQVKCSKKIAFDSSPRTLFLGDPGDEQTITYPIAKKFGLGEGAVAALKDVLGPDAKFITMFRDPVPWAMSNGVQDVLDEKDLKDIQINRSNLGFGKGFLKGQTLTHGFFAKRACYANGLEAWLKVFPRENFLFLTSEDFFADPQATYDQVTDFLGVPRAQYPEDLSKGGSGRRRNSRKHHDDVHEKYHALPSVKSCRERLEKMTGLKLKWTDHVE
ncbi:unnamed protein product, partial [Prorocentrum cordatum]